LSWISIASSEDPPQDNPPFESGRERDIRHTGDEVIGACGCKLWADEGVEIISLVTLTRFQHQGVGTRLILENIKKCKDLGFKWFFAMTVAVDVFLNVGFKKTDYQNLPLKIWVDCASCPHNESDPGGKGCNEEAVELWLD